jgi:hypothetical protein
MPLRFSQSLGHKKVSLGHIAFQICAFLVPKRGERKKEGRKGVQYKRMADTK